MYVFFIRIIKRFEAGEDPERQTGRPRVFSPETIAEATEIASNDDHVKSSRSSAEMGELIVETKLSRHPQTNKFFIPKEVSSSTLRRAVISIAPESAKVDMSTDARKAALADLFNPIAFAAVLHHTINISRTQQNSP